MFKNFFEWLGELEQKNSFSFSLAIFLVIFVIQFILKLIFNAPDLFDNFWMNVERMVFYSTTGALIMFYFAARKKIER